MLRPQAFYNPSVSGGIEVIIDYSVLTSGVTNDFIAAYRQGPRCYCTLSTVSIRGKEFGND